MAPDALPTGQPPSTAWKYAVPLGKRLFDFYPSRGDVTIATATTIAAEANGRMKVVRYGKLTVNALLTVDNPCRGLIILCDELVIGAAGFITMTGKGANVPRTDIPEFPCVDVILPDVLTVQSSNKTYAEFLRLIRDNGICLFDRGYFEGRPGLDCGFKVQPGTGVTVVSYAGCGAGGGRVYANLYYTWGYSPNGGTGVAGTNGGLGGGGGGTNRAINSGSNAVTSGFGGAGGRATPYSSGQGGGGGDNGSYTEDGKNAGTDSAPGVGPASNAGLLIILVKANVTLVSGAVISSDGTKGAATGFGASGASGGGSVFIAYGGVLSNAGTIRANGGAATTGAADAGSTRDSGAGGQGSVQIKPFSALGAAWQ